MALAAFPQAQTPLTITQSAGSATGELRMQERRTNGQNYVGIKAPQSVASNIVWALPTADGTTNQCLSTDGAGQWGWRTCSGASVDLVTTDYDWYQTPGVSLTAATPATVTLTPCPAGVAPYIAHYSTRIAGGTGAAETVLITGVTGSGSTCDVGFTPANNHTGSWTIGSASDGIQEAVNYAIANAGHRVFIPNGAHAVDPKAPGEDSTIYIQGPVWMVGQNQSVNGGAEIALNYNSQWAIVVTTAAVNYPVKLENFAIQGTGLTSSIDPTTGATPTGGGIKITASTGHNLVSKIRDIQFYTLGTGLWCHKCAGTEITGNFFWGFLDYGIYLENTNNTDAGDYTITSNQFQVVYDGYTYTDATALHWASAGGAKIIANKFNLHGAGVNMTFANPSIITVIEGNSFDNQRKPSVKLRAGPGAGGAPIGFLGAVISNNVVTGPGETAYVAFDIGDDTTDYLANVTVSGNTMQANDGTAIKIGDVQQVSVAGNVMGEFTTGIQVAATTVGFAHGKNTIYNVTTPYDINASADVRPISPVFASGYGGWAASASNIKSIAEFSAPTSGEVNNAVLFQTGTTGNTSQRGLWWDTASNMYLSRFPSSRSVNQTDDFQLESDGDARFYYNVGIGRTPASGVALDVNGVSRVSDGTIDLRFQVGGGAGYIGTNTNHPLLFTQAATVRLYLSNSALLPNPSAGDTFNIGDPTIRFLGTYSKIFDTVKSAGTGDYMQTRKLQLYDNTGSIAAPSYWDLNVVMSGAGATQNSYFYLRDNAGNTVWRADKIASGAAVATTTIYTDLLPDSTANVRKLGKTTQRWDEINGASMDLSGAANITGNLSASVINATGSPAYRVSGTTVIDASRNLSNIGTGAFSGVITASAGVAFGASSTFASDAAFDFGTSSNKLRRLYATGWTIYGSAFASSGSAITIQTGATFTDGRTCALGDVWTADGSGNLACAAPSASSLPIADTTNLIKGSADATKLLRFEVDGFTTATTRTLTPQNASYTLAGIDIAQTFTQTQTFNGSTAMVLNGTITGDVLFSASNTYIVGNSTNYANAVHGGAITAYTSFIPGSGVTTVDVGSSTRRIRKVFTGDFDITGTIVPPSGTAFSGTKTVRAAGGASDCTLTFSSGIMTGGTC